MVLDLGMAETLVGVLRVSEGDHGRADPSLAESTRRAIDEAVAALCAHARQRAADVIRGHRGELAALADLLVEKKVIDKAALSALGGVRG
jgi:ATP-dependent Zn protease